MSCSIKGPQYRLYAKDSVIIFLIRLFNKILQPRHIPCAFLKASSSQLKNKKGSQLNPTKYHGITISSTIWKVFEAIISTKIETIFCKQQSSLQFGFTPITVILSASLILAEMLQRNLGTGCKYTVATFLDAKKAFNMVWHDRLLGKLALLDIPIWAALHQWYGNISSKVKWEDHISDEIYQYQGMEQRGTSSTLLYKIFVKDLLRRS